MICPSFVSAIMVAMMIVKTMFTQGNLSPTQNYVINEDPVSKNYD